MAETPPPLQAILANQRRLPRSGPKQRRQTVDRSTKTCAQIPPDPAAFGFVKTRIMGASQQQRVTGIIVNQHQNIDRQSFDQLKAVIHTCKCPEAPHLLLNGRIALVEAVNPARGAKLRRLLAEALTARNRLPPVTSP